MTTTQAPESSGIEYRFDTFRTSLLLDDMRFRRSDPAPGDRIPDFALPTLSNGTLTSRDLGSDRC